MGGFLATVSRLRSVRTSAPVFPDDRSGCTRHTIHRSIRATLRTPVQVLVSANRDPSSIEPITVRTLGSVFFAATSSYGCGFVLRQ